MTTKLTAFGQTDIGLVRTHNEDAFVIADLVSGHLGCSVGRLEIGARGVLLAVSDGMGGHLAGEVASALVLESLERELAKQDGVEDLDVLMEQATSRANRDVWEAAKQPGRTGMGATLTAVFIRHKMAHVATVGDSRVYLLRNGAITQVSRDQSYVQFLIDRGALTPDAAKTFEARSVVLQAMGVAPDVKVALGRLELRQRDCLLLCSDGLSNKVEEHELRELVLTSTKLQEAAGKMIELANARGGEDNITVLLAGVSGDLLPVAPGEPLSETWRVLQEFDVAPEGPHG